MSGGKICKRNDRISQCCETDGCGNGESRCLTGSWNGISLGVGAYIYYCDLGYQLEYAQIISIDIPLHDIILANIYPGIGEFGYRYWGCRRGTVAYRYHNHIEDDWSFTADVYALCEVVYQVYPRCINGTLYVEFAHINIRLIEDLYIDVIECTHDYICDLLVATADNFMFSSAIFVFDAYSDGSYEFLENTYYNDTHPPGYEMCPKITETIPNLMPSSYLAIDCAGGGVVEHDTIGHGGVGMFVNRDENDCTADLCSDNFVIECYNCDNPELTYYINYFDKPTWANSFRVGDNYYTVAGPIVDEEGQPVDEWFSDRNCPQQLRKAYLCDNSAFITYDENDRPDANHVTMFYNGNLYYITDEPSTDNPVNVEWSTGICPTGLYAEAIICDPSYAGSLAPEILTYKVNPNIGLGNGSVKLAITTSNPDCPTDVSARCFHNYYYQPTSNVVTPSSGLIGTHINGESCNMAGFITCIPCGNPDSGPRPSGIVRPGSPEI